MTARRYNDAFLAVLAARLTRRDREILRLVWDNRVLTAPQIAELAFDSADTARKRLLRLRDFGVLERFQPNLPVGAGTAPYHYVIGEAGAAVLAAEDGTAFADFGYRRDHVLSIAYSQKLAHTVGTNGFFTGLVGFARRGRTASLLTWWPEHRCARLWGDTARPDAYGNWAENQHGIDFFLEYDTGTETLDRVTGKLDGYAKLAKATGITTPVLFYVHSERREANLRDQLAAHRAAPAVPVATACRSALITTDLDGPAGRIWLPIAGPALRYRLAYLAQAWPQLAQNGSPAPGQSEVRA